MCLNWHQGSPPEVHVFMSVSTLEHFVLDFCVAKSSTLSYPPGFDPQTGWTVQGSNAGRGTILRTYPDRPWGPPSNLCSEYQVNPGGKVGGVCFGHPPASSAEVKERSELYVSSSPSNFIEVIGWTCYFYSHSQLSVWKYILSIILHRNWVLICYIGNFEYCCISLQKLSVEPSILFSTGACAFRTIKIAPATSYNCICSPATDSCSRDSPVNSIQALTYYF